MTNRLGPRPFNDVGSLRRDVYDVCIMAIRARRPSEEEKFTAAYAITMSNDDAWWTKRLQYTISEWLEEFRIDLPSKPGLVRARRSIRGEVPQYRISKL